MNQRFSVPLIGFLAFVIAGCSRSGTAPTPASNGMATFSAETDSPTAAAAGSEPQILNSQQSRSLLERINAVEILLGQVREAPSSRQVVVLSLLELLGDPDIRVQLHAANALVSLKEKLDEAQAVLLKGIVSKEHQSATGSRYGGIAIAQSLSRIGEPAIPAVVELLQHNDPETRRCAAASLGFTYSMDRHAERIAALKPMLQSDPSASVRGQVAVALATLVRKDEVDVETVRQTAEVLADALDDESPQVRSRTAFALSSIGNRAHQTIPQLIRAFADEVVDVRENAANTVGILASPFKYERGRLLDMLGPSEYRADEELTKTAVEALAGLCADPAAEVRARAARALGYIGTAASAAEATLAEQLSDIEDEPKWWAAATLLQLSADPIDAITVLKQAANSSHRGWRSKASRLLAEHALQSESKSP